MGVNVIIPSLFRRLNVRHVFSVVLRPRVRVIYIYIIYLRGRVCRLRLSYGKRSEIHTATRFVNCVVFGPNLEFGRLFMEAGREYLRGRFVKRRLPK